MAAKKKKAKRSAKQKKNDKRLGAMARARHKTSKRKSKPRKSSKRSSSRKRTGRKSIARLHGKKVTITVTSVAK